MSRRHRSSRRRQAVAGALATLLGVSPAAGAGADINFPVDISVARWRNLPMGLSVEGPRGHGDLGGLAYPREAMTSYGASGGFVISRRVDKHDPRLVLTTGFFSGVSFGSRSAQTGMADDAAVAIGAGTLWVFDFRFSLGFEYRIQNWTGERGWPPNWRVGGQFDIGGAHAWEHTNFTVARGATTAGEFDGDSAVFAFEARVCRRLIGDEHLAWACVNLRTNIAEFGFLSGQSIGLRLEM